IPSRKRSSIKCTSSALAVLVPWPSDATPQNRVTQPVLQAPRVWGCALRRCAGGGMIGTACSDAEDPLLEQEVAGTMRGAQGLESASRLDTPSPNQALQRTAFGIKCLAAGDLALCSSQRRLARVLQRHRAV